MKNEIIIDNWQLGVSKSIYTGHSAMAGLNNKDVGVLKMGQSIIENDNPFETGEYLVVKEGSYSMTSSTGNDNFFYRYFGTGEQKVSAYLNTNHAPGDLKEYHGKVYITNSGGKVDVYDTSTNTMQTDLYSLPAGSGYYDYPMLVASDDILYFGAGGIISSFDNSSFIATACTLPSGRRIVSMLEYQENILILTENSSRTNVKIYSWDRQSNLANLWAEINESSVVNFGVNNGIVYILCGSEYTLYSTVGTQVNKLISFGDYVRTDRISGKFNSNIAYVRAYSNGSQIKNSFLVTQNKILFAPLLNTSSHPFGVYSYNIELGTVTQEYCLPANRSFYTNGTNFSNITCIYKNQSNLYFFMYINNSNTGDVYKLCSIVDGVQYKQTSANQCYYDSALYQTGITNLKKTFNTLSVQLAKPILTTESLNIFYRIDDNSEWISLGDLNATGSKSKEFPFGVTCEYLQIRIFFSSSTASYSETGFSGYLTPELLRIVIK